MILPMEGDEVSGWKPGKPYVFLNTPAAEFAPSFSPDGRWLAYHSNESGRDEVYVRPFPPRDGKWPVSSGGGQWPTWSRTKGELLYQTLDNQIMAVPYTVEGDSFRREAPRLWTERRILRRPHSFGPWTFIRTASEWPPPWRPKVGPRIARTKSSSSSTSSTNYAALRWRQSTERGARQGI